MGRLVPSPLMLWLPMLLVGSPAAAQSGGRYSIASSTIGGGGQTFATSGAYRLGSTVGLANAGPLGGGAYTVHGGFWHPESAVVTDAPQVAAAPTVFAAYAPTPNPFRATMSLSFDLPAPARVSLTLHAVNGRLVRRLLAEQRGPGRHQITWDGRDDHGRLLSAGVYFAQLRAGEFVATQRVLRLH